MRIAAELLIAWRSLLRQPGFFAIAVITLALGVGSVSAIFSVVNGVLLRPLPYPDADRIIRIDRDQPPFSGPVSRQVLEDWRGATGDVFAAMGAFVGGTANLSGDGEAERLLVKRVTPEFWDVLDLPAAVGRYWGADEENGSERVVVLSDALWRRRFGADPGIVGKDIRLDGAGYRVVGVTPPAFRYPHETDAYLPTWLPASAAPRGNNYLLTVARLRDGATPEQATAAMQTINASLAKQYPDENAGIGARLTPLPQLLVSAVREPLLVLQAASALVLLIACANLANLLLARGSQRQRELAVRAALGAGRGVLLRAVLAESTLIALTGGLLGIALAYLAVPLLLRVAPNVMPAHGTPGVDLTVVGVSLAAGLATVLLFALLPALRLAYVTPAGALQEDGRSGTGGRRSGRMRSALVAAEVALSLTLLVGAGLLIESLRRLGDVDRGLQTEHVLTATIVLPAVANIPGESQEDWYLRSTRANAAMLDPLIERFGAIAGVEAVALSDALPLANHGGTNSNITIVGSDAPTTGADEPWAQWRFVNPQFFDAFGIPLLRGRALTQSDSRAGEWPRDIVVNESFVRLYLGDGDPIGRQVTFFGGEAPKTIVGVVADTRLHGLDSAPPPEMYMAHGHAFTGQYYVALKVRGEPMAYADALRRTVREFAADVPVLQIRPMEELVADGSRLRRFNMQLMSAFSAVALLLAAIGLYGVISYAVAQRRQEFGIRMSLGADGRRLLMMVLRHGMSMVVWGSALGLLGAIALGHALSSQLFGVNSTEPTVYAGVLGALLTTAAIACALPARRASKVDPMVALRSL